MAEESLSLEDLHPGWWLVRSVNNHQPPFIVSFVRAWANASIIHVGTCPGDPVVCQVRFLENPWMWTFEPLRIPEAPPHA